jgi:DNA-binding transcriptional LysR family regulator
VDISRTARGLDLVAADRYPWAVLLRHLEYLTALARERHFARAAAACHVSQPSLSEGIRRLETDLKVSIVVRGRRFVDFTPEGELVLAWARRILADCDGLHQEVAASRGELSGVLRVGAIPTAVTAVSLLTAPFCERNPGARVRLESASAQEILRGLADFDLDVGLTYVDGELPPGVRADPLYRERYLLLTPDDGPLAGRATVGWAELDGVAMCLLAPVMRNRQLLDAAFAAAGASVPAAVEADTVSAIYAHVGTGRWSSVVAHVWLHQFGVPDGLRVVPMEEPAVPVPFVGLLRSDRDPAPIMARALAEVADGLDLQATLDTVLARHLIAPPPSS